MLKTGGLTSLFIYAIMYISYKKYIIIKMKKIIKAVKKEYPLKKMMPYKII